MQEPVMTCPHCKTQIKLTESLAAPIIEAQLKKDRAFIALEEARKAKLAIGADLEQEKSRVLELQAILQSRESKLAEAQKMQADLMKKERELDDTKRELDLTIEKRVQEGLQNIRFQAKKEAENVLQLKVFEKEQTIFAMQKQIEALKQKAEQGSEQLQGEVQELQLEALLREKFPFDQIVPVLKGEYGGDVLHHVSSLNGQRSGSILWESKRTKNWSDSWLVKLRNDQRVAKAEISVIVSRTLPKDIATFEQIDGVWVVHPTVALPIAMILRHTLIEISLARQSVEGQQTKKEMVYQYLTGPRFRQRVEAIVEAFSSMKEDLDKEKKMMMKQWAKREMQIECVMTATLGMYGDLQGIAGQSIQEIEGLALHEEQRKQLEEI